MYLYDYLTSVAYKVCEEEDTLLTDACPVLRGSVNRCQMNE